MNTKGTVSVVLHQSGLESQRAGMVSEWGDGVEQISYLIQGVTKGL